MYKDKWQQNARDVAYNIKRQICNSLYESPRPFTKYFLASFDNADGTSLK